MHGRSDKLKLLDVNRTGVGAVDLTRFPALRCLKLFGSLVNWIDLREFPGVERLDLGPEQMFLAGPNITIRLAGADFVFRNTAVGAENCDTESSCDIVNI